MDVKKIYVEDLEIAKSIIQRDKEATFNFFYRKYLPMFKSIYNNYYTDCTCYNEFINEIYILVLLPNKKDGKCKLEDYKGESSLGTWLRTVALYYCYKKYKKKKEVLSLDDSIIGDNEKKYTVADRCGRLIESISIDLKNINTDDVKKILDIMPNKKYAKLINVKYLELKSHKETADVLGVSMHNYYNMHKRAKEQYENCLKKEVHYE